jgi:hypothetical protein
VELGTGHHTKSTLNHQSSDTDRQTLHAPDM